MIGKKRLLLIVGSLAACVCLLLGVLTMLPPRPGVTKANFGRIQEGMPLADVEGIFGRRGELWGFAGGDRFNWVWRWRAKDKSVVEVMVKSDCVTGKVWQDSDETFFDKIGHWLHLQ